MIDSVVTGEMRMREISCGWGVWRREGRRKGGNGHIKVLFTLSFDKEADGT